MGALPANTLGICIIVLCVSLAVLRALWRWSPEVLVELVCAFVLEIVAWSIAIAIVSGAWYLIGAACHAGGL